MTQTITGRGTPMHVAEISEEPDYDAAIAALETD